MRPSPAARARAETGEHEPHLVADRGEGVPAHDRSRRDEQQVSRIETEEQRMIHNYMVTLLENMGITQGLNFDALIDSMLALTIPEKQQ